MHFISSEAVQHIGSSGSFRKISLFQDKASVLFQNIQEKPVMLPIRLPASSGDPGVFRFFEEEDQRIFYTYMLPEHAFPFIRKRPFRRADA